MKYAVVVERGEQSFGAYVPDLPRCVAVGDSLRETKRLIREAIDLHLVGMRSDGLPIPKPSTVVASIAVRTRVAPPKRRASPRTALRARA
jgi:predicted RNase H-like HicB family nuclease